MEGIVIIAIIYALFKMFANKGKVTTEQGKPTSATPAAEQGTHQKYPTQPQAHRHRPAEPAPQSLKTAMEGAEKVPYQTIKPMVFKDHVMEQYAGSLSTASQEGLASQEGSLSGEGGSQRSDRIARTDSAEAYRIAEPQAAGEGENVFPLNLQGNALVQAVIMSEVLGKPRKRGEYHG